MDFTNASFSIEFYPPRTAEGESTLDAVHAELAALGPEYFSVTYGAGGSTRTGTSKLVLKYRAAGSEVAPHLSFAGTDESDVREHHDGFLQLSAWSRGFQRHKQSAVPDLSRIGV